MSPPFIPPEIISMIIDNVDDIATLKNIRLTSIFAESCVDMHQLFDKLHVRNDRDQAMNRIDHMRTLDLLQYVHTVVLHASAYFPSISTGNGLKSDLPTRRSMRLLTQYAEANAYNDALYNDDFGAFHKLLSRVFGSLHNYGVWPQTIRVIVKFNERDEDIIQRTKLQPAYFKLHFLRSLEHILVWIFKSHGAMKGTFNIEEIVYPAFEYLDYRDFVLDTAEYKSPYSVGPGKNMEMRKEQLLGEQAEVCVYKCNKSPDR